MRSFGWMYGWMFGSTRRRIKSGGIALAAFATLCAPGRAQQGPLNVPLPHADLRVDVSLAMIPVNVTNLRGEPVIGLTRGDFHLFEDGVEQPVKFLAGEDAPLSIGVLLDLSSSMRNKLRRSAEAALQLLKSFTGRDDEFFLVEFNERPKLSVPLTQNVLEIQSVLAHARTMGRTSLLDAIHLAKAHLKSAHNTRKAIVILSDGGDNHSRFTQTEIRHEMRESDVQVYAMSIPSAPGRKALPPEEEAGPRLLQDVADETGGRHLDLTALDDLSSACARIARELQNQYVVGYSPATRDGQYHHIRIVAAGEVGGGALRVYHRPGLSAPSQ